MILMMERMGNKVIVQQVHVICGMISWAPLHDTGSIVQWLDTRVQTTPNHLDSLWDNNNILHIHPTIR
jgi:hypothetical protein